MFVKSVAGSRESPQTGHVLTQTKDLFAGLAASIMTVAYGLSFAALIFSASLHTWLAYGLAATFITTAISASFVAERRFASFRHSRT
jgi:SulP family sulfate permease